MGEIHFKRKVTHRISLKPHPLLDSASLADAATQLAVFGNQCAHCHGFEIVH